MGRTIYSRVNLLKWSIPPYNSIRRYTHDAGQWEILEEVLSLKGYFLDQVNPTPLIEDSPWSVRWIRVWDPGCLGEYQRKTFSFNRSHHGRSASSRPNIGDIMMHDVNIEAMIKLEPCHYSHDQVNTIPLIEDSSWSITWIRVEIQDAWESTKKRFLIQWITSRSINAEPAKDLWHYDAWCQYWRNDKGGNSDFSLVTLWSYTYFAFFFITLLHLSYNKSANFSILNVYFAEDNHREKEDYTK